MTRRILEFDLKLWEETDILGSIKRNTKVKIIHTHMKLAHIHKQDCQLLW